MNLNRRLMLLLSNWLFYHFESFDFKQNFAVGLIIVFKAITKDCLHQVTALIVIATGYLVTLYLVAHSVEEVAMKLMEFKDPPL